MSEKNKLKMLYNTLYKAYRDSKIITKHHRLLVAREGLEPPTPGL
jgi:hypothetical protein